MTIEYADLCPHFGECGGCALQHLEDQRYAAWKEQLVRTALADLPAANPEWLSSFAAPQPYLYGGFAVVATLAGALSLAVTSRGTTRVSKSRSGGSGMTRGKVSEPGCSAPSSSRGV